MMKIYQLFLCLAVCLQTSLCKEVLHLHCTCDNSLSQAITYEGLKKKIQIRCIDKF